MATLPVYNLKREEVGSIEVSDAIFAAEVKRHLFYEVIKWQQAKRRAGTAATKGRNDVAGGGAKPYRQKGTGRARQGSRRAPNHVGGGVVHGPTPRSYAYNLNKKVRKGAMKSALSLRASQAKLLVVDSLALETHRTRDAAQVFKALAQGNALVVDGPNRNLELAVGNLPKVKYLSIDGMNLFDVLKYDHLVMTEPTVRRLEGALGQ
ncbi:MAG: 50S ribosomal protein L4 [Myxococcales bacterium]|nr:50S ribosomal protein L4 [Myxococcales bacterium]